MTPTALLVATLLSALSAAPPCPHFDADTVALSGRLERRVYPGRPNYESVAAGDALDTVFVLRLTRPVCARASASDTAHRAIREVQLEFPRGEAPFAMAQLGRGVTLRGTLHEWAWGWHHVPVLLRTSVGGARRVRPQPRAA